jgi:hypothetical protein
MESNEDMMRKFLNEILAEIKTNRAVVSKILEPYLSNIDLSNRQGKRKQKELIDVVKFIVAFNEPITILYNNSEEPDFIVNWNGEAFGLEHTEVMDEEMKREFEINERFVKQIEEHFLTSYGDIGQHINISFKAEVAEITQKERDIRSKKLTEYAALNLTDEQLFRMAYPGYLTRNEMKKLSKEIAEKIYDAFINHYEYFDDPFLHYVSFYPSKQTSIHRVFGYSAGTISDLLMKCLEKKEERLNTYLENTNNIKQCLLLVIQGSNGHSDYAYFDSNILQNKNTRFDKVIAFNFLTAEWYILK